jgi:peptidoglycan/xylan/chitin deacetylase (PgdA/CDA1 family)
MRSFPMMLVSSIETGERHVALTLDDGPSSYTESILAILAEEAVLATFFIRGGAINRETREIVKAVHAAGHDVGNHTHHHLHLELCDEPTLRQEIVRTHHHLEELTGDFPQFIRPPYGQDPKRVDAVASELGYRATVLWTISPTDWDDPQPPAEALVERVLEGLHPGAIVLLHDGVSPEQQGGSRFQTVAALRTLIPALRERGFEPVSLSRLLSPS